MDERSEILKLNDYLQKTEGARKTDGLRWALQIPMDDYNRLTMANPSLQSKDTTLRTKAWESFMKSPMSIPYRVREKI